MVLELVGTLLFFRAVLYCLLLLIQLYTENDDTCFNICNFVMCYIRGNRSRMVNPPSILDDLVDPDSLDEMEDVTGKKCVVRL